MKRVWLWRRIRLWRRRWCLWRGHEMAAWSPTVLSYVDANGDEWTTRQWRCARHDRLPS